MVPSKAPVLLLGGTGKVARRIAHQLAATHQPVLVATRKGSAVAGGVLFDWNDRETWGNAFAAAQPGKPAKGGPPISAIFLVCPPILDVLSIMSEYIDFARSQGVRRFVLLSSSAVEEGGAAMGKVHSYLSELGSKGEVEWAVLRPTWFQQNLSEHEHHVHSIKIEGKLYSATSDGRIPWVSVEDIAAVAARALTAEEAPNTDYVILGPELLSYGDVAEILSEVLGKKVVHVDLPKAQLEAGFESAGMPKDYAELMSALDTSIKHGAEDRTNDVVLSLTGRQPKKFRDFAESVKSVWQ